MAMCDDALCHLRLAPANGNTAEIMDRDAPSMILPARPCSRTGKRESACFVNLPDGRCGGRPSPVGMKGPQPNPNSPDARSGTRPIDANGVERQIDQTPNGTSRSQSSVGTDPTTDVLVNRNDMRCVNKPSYKGSVPPIPGLF